MNASAEFCISAVAREAPQLLAPTRARRPQISGTSDMLPGCRRWYLLFRSCCPRRRPSPSLSRSISVRWATRRACGSCGSWTSGARWVLDRWSRNSALPSPRFLITLRVCAGAGLWSRAGTVGGFCTRLPMIACASCSRSARRCWPTMPSTSSPAGASTTGPLMSEPARSDKTGLAAVGAVALAWPAARKPWRVS